MDAGLDGKWLEGEEEEDGGWEGGKEEGREGGEPEEERPTSAARREGIKEGEVDDDGDEEEEIDNISPLSGAASFFSPFTEDEEEAEEEDEADEEEEDPAQVRFSDVDRIVLIPARCDYDEETKELLWWALEDYVGFKKRSLRLLNMGKKEFVTLDPIELKWEEEERRMEGREVEEEGEEEEEEEAVPVTDRAQSVVMGEGKRGCSPSPATDQPSARESSSSVDSSIPVRLMKALSGEEIDLSVSAQLKEGGRGGGNASSSPLLTRGLVEETSGPVPSIYSFISHNTPSHLLTLPHGRTRAHRRYSSLSSSPVEGAFSSLPLSFQSLLLSSGKGGRKEGEEAAAAAAAAGRRYDYLVGALDLATALGVGRKGSRMIMGKSGHEGAVSWVHLREDEIMELSLSQA